MVCPLIVEDLSTPGQMLIEVSNGFFVTYKPSHLAES